MVFHIATVKYVVSVFRTLKNERGFRRKVNVFLLVTAVVCFTYLLVPCGRPAPLKGGFYESADAVYPDDWRIFFHETSGRDHLKLRQSCTVESAALHNPNRSIQVFLHSEEFNHSSPFASIARQYNNIAVILLDEREYFRGTQLWDWYKEGEWLESMYKIVHMADYVRFLSLFKGGGMYMDLDYVTLRPLDEKVLWNFFLIEGPAMKLLSNSVIHLTRGHRLIYDGLSRLAKTYEPDIYFWHGPSLVSNIMHKNCGIKRGQPYHNDCTDVKLMPYNSFCPIPTETWEVLFRDAGNETSMNALLNETYAVHAWDGKSQNEPLLIGSNQLYAVLAAKNCPLTIARASEFSA